MPFTPKRKRFADMLVKRAKGEKTDDDGLELNPEFKEKLKNERSDNKTIEDDGIIAEILEEDSSASIVQNDES